MVLEAPIKDHDISTPQSGFKKCIVSMLAKDSCLYSKSSLQLHFISINRNWSRDKNVVRLNFRHSGWSSTGPKNYAALATPREFTECVFT